MRPKPLGLRSRREQFVVFCSGATFVNPHGNSNLAAMPSITPPQVTRFYGTTDFALDVIENKQIAFVHALKLNDPFDPYGFFETDFEDSYAKLLQHVQKRHPNDLLWFSSSVTAQSWGQTVTELKSYLQGLRETTFVLSTCAEFPGVRPEHNLYMWGHYANGHRGVAIEFNTHALANAVLSHHAAVGETPLGETNVWAKMEYVKTFPPITAEDVYEFMKQEMELLARKITVRTPTNLDVYYSRMSTIKNDVWQNENEWRLMWRNDEIKERIFKCPIGSDAIASIFLGMMLAPDVRKRILSSGRQHFPAARIFQARKRHGDLALQFDRQ